MALPDALLTTIPPGSDVAGVPGVVLTHLNAALRLAELALRPPSPTEADDGVGHKPRSPGRGVIENKHSIVV